MRSNGIPVTPTEWLGVCEVLMKHPDPNLDVLYNVTRAVCVKHEMLYDAYDRAFAEEFSIERRREGGNAVQDLLKALADGSAAQLGKLGFEIPPELALLLAENKDAIGKMLSDSEAEFPDGTRFDEKDGGRSAMRVALQRRFKNYRSDVTLDTRTLRVALSRLRRLLPEGPCDQLDLQGTIARSSKNAGEIELVFQRQKKNRVKLVLLMDAGGTMTPHATSVSRLFSAAKSQFQDLRAYYFHNCPYQQVYHDIERRQAVPMEELLRLGQDHWLLMVGDAHMNGMELIRPGGAVEGPYNEEPGLVWLQRLRDRFVRSVWLNPVVGATGLLSNHSVLLVQSVFDMHPLTVDGIDKAMRYLMQKKAA